MDVWSVVVVEDHEMVATALSDMLDDHPDFVVVGTAYDVAAAIALVRRTQPRVVLSDQRLRDGDGAQLATAIRTSSPGSAVLILTADPTADVVTAALETGCAGVIGKSAPVQELLSALRIVAGGGTYFSHGALTEARQREQTARLSEREREVLQRVALGVTTHDIARELHLSEHTVRNHLRRALARLGARNRLDAVVIAARRGEIVLDGPRP